MPTSTFGVGIDREGHVEVFRGGQILAEDPTSKPISTGRVGLDAHGNVWVYQPPNVVLADEIDPSPNGGGGPDPPPDYLEGVRATGTLAWQPQATGEVGLWFTVNRAIRVTHLGRRVGSNDATAQTTMRLMAPVNTDRATATVNNIDDSWVWGSITPAVLSPGTTYFLRFSRGQGPWVTWAFVPQAGTTVAPEIATWGPSSQASPNGVQSAGSAFFGPVNFRYELADPPPFHNFLVPGWTTGSSYTGEHAGMRFTVGSQAIRITALGRYQHAGDDATAQMTLYADGTTNANPVEGATITNQVTGQFSYAALEPSFLCPAGSSYVLEQSAPARYQEIFGSASQHFSFRGPMWRATGSIHFTFVSGAGANLFGPVDFRYQLA